MGFWKTLLYFIIQRGNYFSFHKKKIENERILSYDMHVRTHIPSLRRWNRTVFIIFHVKALKYLLFVSNQVTHNHQLIWHKKVNISKSFTWKILFIIHLEIVKRFKKLNSYVEILFKKRLYCAPPPKKNIILFELEFNVKYPFTISKLPKKYYFFSLP